MAKSTFALIFFGTVAVYGCSSGGKSAVSSELEGDSLASAFTSELNVSLPFVPESFLGDEALVVEAVENAYEFVIQDLKERRAIEPETTSQSLGAVFQRNLRWKVIGGKVELRVAFEAGTTDAEREVVMSIANAWVTPKDTFKPVVEFLWSSNGMPNFWSTGDPEDNPDRAHIRIRINQDVANSRIGRDAWSVPGNRPTMNLSKILVTAPEDLMLLKYRILHEFGHALSFVHEHQSPEGSCEKELQWEEPCDYWSHRKWEKKEGWLGVQYVPSGTHEACSPGVYRFFGSEPTNWSRPKTDSQLRSENSVAYGVSPIDDRSVMTYFLPRFLFVNGTKPSCFAEFLPQELSTTDMLYSVRAYTYGDPIGPLSSEENLKIEKAMVKRLESSKEKSGIGNINIDKFRVDGFGIDFQDEQESNGAIKVPTSMTIDN